MPLHLLLLPGLLLVLVYSYVPMLGVVIAFQKFTIFSGWFGSPWIGFDNFKFVLDMPNTGQVIWNTIFIACMKIAFGLFVPIVVALLLNEVSRSFVKRGVQTLIYLPHFLSWVILGGILIDLLSPSEGIVNAMLGKLGIEPISSWRITVGFPRC